MNSKEILKLLIDRDVTAADIARDISCTRQMVHRVIKGELETPWVRRELAGRLGMTYRGMWGGEDPGTERGVPLRRSGSSPARVALSTSRGAA